MEGREDPQVLCGRQAAMQDQQIFKYDLQSSNHVEDATRTFLSDHIGLVALENRMCCSDC
jgi:hypothetical protein